MIYLVTDPALCSPLGVAATVRAAVDAGVRWVQVRDKHADDDSYLRTLAQVCEVAGGRAVVVVNDRVDAFVQARRAGLAVHGVHIGQGDMDPVEVRALTGPEAIVGLSASRPEEITAANSLPEGTVDYLGVGVIRATATKKDHPDALGVDGFARVAASTPLPCVAIGGIGVADLAPLRAVGASGAAVVSAICGQPDPSGVARILIEAWNSPASASAPGDQP